MVKEKEAEEIVEKAKYFVQKNRTKKNGKIYK